MLSLSEFSAGRLKESAVYRALVRRAISLSSNKGRAHSGARGGSAVGAVGSMCTLGSGGTLGGAARGVDYCCSCTPTLGDDALGGCCNVNKIDQRLFDSKKLVIRFGWGAVGLYCCSQGTKAMDDAVFSC